MFSLFFFCVGVLGTFAMTWLFPILARLLARAQAPRPPRSPRSGMEGATGRAKLRVAVLVPAYNEEAKIGRTLSSIQAALARARELFPAISFSVHVGSDGSSDGTADVALRLGASVIRGSQRRGKWRMISMLVSVARESDWVILADAGIQWPEDFVRKLIPLCRDESIMAIAPTYRAPDAGWLENLVWSVETHLKSMESAMGGPVTVHGATVVYRTAELRRALGALGPGNWLNDDVVVPLTLRALFPGKSIRYVSELGVYDQLRSEAQQTGTASRVRPGREFSRRRRMVYGNIQWIRRILPSLWRRNAVAGLLALRRVCRVLWAWWGLSIILGAALLAFDRYERELLTLSPALMACLAALATGAVASLFAGGKVVESAAASLLAPYYCLVGFKNEERISWT